MMRKGLIRHGCTVVILLAFAIDVQAGSIWDYLWRNANQQGAQLIHQGRAAEAAKTYQDHRSKAYAELLAGDYQKAAKDFMEFNDTHSHYNRGNALAYAGQLQEAIKAYDTALKQDPNNKDALHNRALVAKALGQKQTKDQQGKEQQGKEQQQKGKNNQRAAQGTLDSTRADKKNDNSNTDKSVSKNDSTQHNKNQVGQNTDISLTQPQTGKENYPSASGKPETEQQLALEQWLQQIPDDPGGLLRRKFLIEHIIRQQGRGQ
ncbi:MAG: tetratricopeptide repeat protein [Pseudomonadota bacterium]